MNTTDTDLQTFTMVNTTRENAAQPCWYVEIWAPGEQDRPRYLTRYYFSRDDAVADAERWVKSYLTRTTGT